MFALWLFSFIPVSVGVGEIDATTPRGVAAFFCVIFGSVTGACGVMAVLYSLLYELAATHKELQRARAYSDRAKQWLVRTWGPALLILMMLAILVDGASVQ